jgi:hypothetical protein
MHIVCLGFAGTSQIEAEAASQLVRLERFSKSISGCHLAIESIRPASERCGADGLAGDRDGPVFDARLDLIMRSGEFVPIGHCVDTDANAAIQAAFDSAEQELERGPARSRS